MPAKKAETLVLDGKKQDPGNLERAARSASFFCSPPDEAPDTVLAFTTEQRYRRWARLQGVLNHYDEGEELVRKARKERPSPSREKELARLQRDRVLSETKRVDAELKLRGVDLRNMTRAQMRLLERLSAVEDLYGGPIIGSAWIFNKVGQGGAYRYLATGLLYPVFSWFGFNDRAESGIVTWPMICKLYEHSWYSGKKHVFQGLRNTFYGFNNKASSGLVY